jgi:hypothetical protein
LFYVGFENKQFCVMLGFGTGLGAQNSGKPSHYPTQNLNMYRCEFSVRCSLGVTSLTDDRVIFDLSLIRIMGVDWIENKSNSIPFYAFKGT